MITHADLVALARRWLRQRRCIVVVTESGHEEKPDAIGWLDGSLSIVVEAKRTRKDFLAERSRQDRKQHRRVGGMGTNRYYIARPGVIRRSEAEELGWGLIEAWSTRRLHTAVESRYFDADRAAEFRLLLLQLSKVSVETSEEVQRQLALTFT